MSSIHKQQSSIRGTNEPVLPIETWEALLILLPSLLDCCCTIIPQGGAAHQPFHLWRWPVHWLSVLTMILTACGPSADVTLLCLAAHFISEWVTNDKKHHILERN